MTATQIPADMAADIDFMQSMADDPALTDDDRLAWQRLACSLRAMTRGDLKMAGAHLSHSLAANPDIFGDILDR